MKTWIAKEIVSILGFEDDVLIDMIYNMLALDEVCDCKWNASRRRSIRSISKSH